MSVTCHHEGLARPGGGHYRHVHVHRGPVGREERLLGSDGVRKEFLGGGHHLPGPIPRVNTVTHGHVEPGRVHPSPPGELGNRTAATTMRRDTERQHAALPIGLHRVSDGNCIRVIAYRTPSLPDHRLYTISHLGDVHAFLHTHSRTARSGAASRAYEAVSAVVTNDEETLLYRRDRAPGDHVTTDCGVRACVADEARREAQRRPRRLGVR